MMPGICGLDEGISMLLCQISCIPECSSTLNKSLPCVRHPKRPKLVRVVLWPATGRGGRGGMVGIHLEYSIMVG